ncbi:hypothetical protein SEMRO_3017_G342130.1 [Seminavis robusta]|uniref:Uncharacterized protein n=1 Tax=Seminavis robusta TaxID=568900 RepID=A0A9N8F4M4_9STRA|nr:hypothetical protein SEMRO_3017_G342130.1 [Seminavis robusta]|eukprot:Sro3017_g342130.1 n/a (207) ;mRNA; r:2128-2748
MSLNQARRRSSTGSGASGGSASATTATAATNGTEGDNETAMLGGKFGGVAYEVYKFEPSEDTIIAIHSSKKKDTPLTTKPEKIKLLQAIVDKRDDWFGRACKSGGLNRTRLEADMREFIPKLTDARWPMEVLAEKIYHTHRVLKKFIDTSSRTPNRAVLAPFEPLDEMVKYATHEARKAKQIKIDDQTPTWKFLKSGGVHPLKKPD